MYSIGMTADLIGKPRQSNYRSGWVLSGTGSYEKEDGTKVYTTDVIADRIYFERGTVLVHLLKHLISQLCRRPKADAKPVVICLVICGILRSGDRCT